jgi:hypothetical protein
VLVLVYTLMCIASGLLLAAEYGRVFGDAVAVTVAGFWIVVSLEPASRALPPTLASPQPVPALPCLLHALLMKWMQGQTKDKIE